MKKIDLLFGVLGFPVKHSLSPAIHNYIFKQLKLTAYYSLFEVKPERIKEALVGTKALGFKGLNITVPFKERVIPYLDWLSKEAKTLGAVNTIKIEANKLKGYNTDIRGFLLSLEKYNFSPHNKNILILGAGGAASSVAFGVLTKKPKKVSIYNRTYERAKKLTLKLKKIFPSSIEAIPQKEEIELKDFDLIINATSLGLKSNDPLPLELKALRRGVLVYDLVYNPYPTKFLKQARARKVLLADGLWMLIYQALLSEGIWWGRNFLKFADKLYRHLIRKRR